MLNVAGQPDQVPAGRIDDASSLELYAAFEPDGATRLAVAAYRLHGRGGFGAATPEAPAGMRDGFAFVLGGDGRAAARGAGPGMAGAATALPSEPGCADGGAARAWLYRHDGRLSGPSYDVRDAGAEAVVRSMAHLDNAGREVVDMVRRRHVPGMAVQFVIGVDGDYLAHPGFRAGAPSGMPAPEDGAGIRHDVSLPVRGGGRGVRRGARGLGLMAGYRRGTCTPCSATHAGGSFPTPNSIPTRRAGTACAASAARAPDGMSGGGIDPGAPPNTGGRSAPSATPAGMTAFWWPSRRPCTMRWAGPIPYCGRYGTAG